jgi:peptidylprolyl isomerase
MAVATSGDTVRVHYTGSLDNGTVFDSSEGREPLEFEVGSGSVIPGFDQAVLGLEVGDSTTVTIAPEQAYGPRREEYVVQFPLSQFPEEIVPEAGMQLQMRGQDGTPIPVLVTEVGEEQVTLDANHRLAGENLTFEISLVEIR